MNKNNVKNSETMRKNNNGAQVGSEAANAHRTTVATATDAKREALMAATTASRDLKSLFGVEFSTIIRKIREAKNGKRVTGVIARGQHKVNGYVVNVYITVNERDVDGYTNYDVYAEAYNGQWSLMGVETEKMKVNFRGWNQEEAVMQAVGGVMVNYINSYFTVAEAAEEAAKETEEAAEETAKETENDYWNRQVKQTEEYITGRLEECGMNALKLADALVEAYKNTDGTRYYGEVPTLALWVAFKAKIVARLESLGDGAQTPAPGLEKAAEKSSEINGNPAPCLRDEIESMLAADVEKMYETEDGYDIDYHRVGDYWLQTTAESDYEHCWMNVTMRLTNEAKEKYILDAHEAWELCWRVEFDEDIETVAGKIVDAMTRTPRTLFRDGADYRGDDGNVYTLYFSDWDEDRESYILDIEDENGDTYIGVTDTEGTVVTVYNEMDDILTVFHAEDVIE